MVKKTTLGASLIISTAALISTACVPQVTVLPNDQAQAFAEEVEPIVENLLVGLSESDYAKHTRDFDEDMRQAVDETVAFPQMVEQIIGVIGTYQTHTLLRVEDQGEFRAAIYDAVFSHEPHVTVRVVFRLDDPDHKVSGLWFDSPLLREQQR